jgi:electron transfer flavoprotein alpha subunit
MGMENSEYVIAVNLDEKAGIFEFANLRIKGDLREVIPAVIRRLREHLAAAGGAQAS